MAAGAVRTVILIPQPARRTGGVSMSRLVPFLTMVALTAALALTSPAAIPLPLRVMPLGDSITYGMGSANSRPARTQSYASGYRPQLLAYLQSAGLNVDFVGSLRSGPPDLPDPDHEGHPGWLIDQVAHQVDGWLATYQPDAVLLHIGTNDLFRNQRVTDAPRRLSDLIDRIRRARPEAHIFVQRLVPGHVGDHKKRVEAYNKSIPAMVARKDARVHLVDQSRIGALSLFDNVHPNDFGYAKMAHTLYLAMKRVYGTPAWPNFADPHAATSAHLCFQINTRSHGVRTWYASCAEWFHRPGRNPPWQRLTTVTEHDLVRVRGNPDRYELRIQTVRRWRSDDPYLTGLKR